VLGAGDGGRDIAWAYPEPLRDAKRVRDLVCRARIAKGEWRNGPLPSVKQLQQEHDVGRDTVLRAVEILRDEGLVFTVPRRGTYVSPDTR
jgi:GntR family transcriptional regulator